MTTVLIGTVNGKFICGIDEGEWGADSSPLKMKVVNNEKQKYLDFDCGVIGRIMVSGYLGHQCMLHKDCLKDLIEVLRDEYFANLKFGFSTIQELGTDVARWLSIASWHNRVNDNGSNVKCRSIYICGRNTVSSRESGELKYDDINYELKYSPLQVDFNIDGSLNMGMLSTPAYFPTEFEGGFEETIAAVICASKKIHSESHESLRRLDQSLIDLVNIHAELCAKAQLENQSLEEAASVIVTSLFKTLSELGLRVAFQYETQEAMDTLNSSAQNQLRNIFKSSAGDGQIRII